MLSTRAEPSKWHGAGRSRDELREGFLGFRDFNEDEWEDGILDEVEAMHSWLMETINKIIIKKLIIIIIIKEYL